MARDTGRSVVLWASAWLASTILLACSSKAPVVADTPSSYLFIWAGPHGSHRDTASAASVSGQSDFLGVLDADPASRTYGKALASRAVGNAGAMAHHTELTLPAGRALFANDYLTGQIFLLDVSDPLAPRVTSRIDSVPGFRRPHSFARLPNGNVVASLQFGNGTMPGDPGGLAEFDPAGRLLRTSSAADPAFPGARIRPNGLELLAGIDRAVTTSMPMDDERTADVIQIWRLSDLHLLHTIAMPPPTGDSLHFFPYDVRALADGRTAMLNTYYCGFYRVSAIESEQPRLELVHALRPHREGCAVAIVAGHYWVIPVAYDHSVLCLDVADPEHPVEASTLRTDSTFMPHWLSADPASDRIVITGTDDGEARVLMARLDRTTGHLSWDVRFHGADSTRQGIGFDRLQWPNGGGVSHPMAHAALFGSSRR